MRMANRRHPEVAETMLDGMVRGPVECFRVVRSCAQTLTDAGFEMPPWRLLTEVVEAAARVWVATEGLSGAPQEILSGGSFATSHGA